MKISGAFTLLLTVASTSAFAPLSQQHQQQHQIISRSSSSTHLSATTAPKKKQTDSSIVVASSGPQPNAAIQVMAQGMTLLKPIFGAEAQLQAAVLSQIAGGVDASQVANDIQNIISKNKIVIYTYALSPFSTEAVRLLTESGLVFEQIELGAEWFLLGAEESVTRVELSKLDESGATSLPKIFVNGQCIGGCANLATIIQSGEFDTLVKPKAAAAKKEKLFGLF
jgi:glutaredoxin 3